MAYYNHIFFVLKRRDTVNNKEVYKCFTPDPDVIKNCGSGPYFKVRVTETQKDEKSSYWGWKDFENNCYRFISHDKELTQSKAKEYIRPVKKKQGKIVNLSLEKLCKIV